MDTAGFSHRRIPLKMLVNCFSASEKNGRIIVINELNKRTVSKRFSLSCQVWSVRVHLTVHRCVMSTLARVIAAVNARSMVLLSPCQLGDRRVSRRHARDQQRVEKPRQNGIRRPYLQHIFNSRIYDHMCRGGLTSTRLCSSKNPQNYF